MDYPRFLNAVSIIKQLLGIIPRNTRCFDLHHDKKDQHEIVKPCPVEKRRNEILQLADDFISSLSNTKTERPEFKPSGSTECSCNSCLSAGGIEAWWMVVCEICGNKRCPHTANHRNECNGSNDVPTADY